MKKIGSLFVALAFFCMPVKAQTTMQVSHGSFEQWSFYPGYSVSLMGISFPVLDTFSYPTGWNYLSYHVNQSVSFMGFPVSINTDMPLIKVGREVGGVPNGSSAVRLQTFMVEDLVNSTVYNLAASSLDSMITQTIFPSVLSTGVIDMDVFIPMLTSVLANMDSVQSLLVSMAQMDVNELITGGIALGDFEPTRLTGNYKYHSAVSGDNGGVLLLGTHYNPVTHQRDLVGGGVNIALTDVTGYTPFTVNYMSLHDYQSAFPEQAPDSLVILLISSANTNRQQGSWLCVDNLVLWHDTCADIANTSVLPNIHDATINWSVSGTVNGYELEYGIAGFALGTGTSMSITSSTAILSGLSANTSYDVYIRTLCDNNIYGDWDTLQFTTNQDTCASIIELHVQNTPDAFPANRLEWEGSSRPDHWEVEYGLRGFEHGHGILVVTSETYFDIYTLEENGTLQPNTWYDFYVRSVCGDGIYGEWDSVQYRTYCAKVSSITLWDDSVLVNSNAHLVGYKVTWIDTTDTQEWYVYYDETASSDYTPGYISGVYTNEPVYYLPELRPNTQYYVSITAECGDENFGPEKWIIFTTKTAGIEDAESFNLSLYPNPSLGSCTVSLSSGEPAELKLYTLDGRLLQTQQYAGTPVSLQLKGQGVYLLHVTTATGTVIRKIVNK